VESRTVGTGRDGSAERNETVRGVRPGAMGEKKVPNGADGQLTCRGQTDKIGLIMIKVGTFPLMVVGIALCAGMVHAGPLLNTPETWDSPPAQEGWDNDAPDGVGTGDGTISASGGWLQIVFAEQVGEPTYEEDTMYANGADYIGNYTTSTPLAVRFQFYASDILPGDVALYVHSSDGGGALWEYALTVGSVGQWIDIAVPLYYTSDWVGPGGSADFLVDMASVDWIGVNIARSTLDLGEQEYRIDNWEYFVPEPGTIWALVAAFFSLSIAARQYWRRKNVTS
jgi:hypothetical protein